MYAKLSTKSLLKFTDFKAVAEFHCSNSELKGLLKDYWESDYAENFIYTQKYLLSKYGFKSSTTLESTIKKYGYGFIDKEKYLCTDCKKPYKFLTRKDLKNLFNRYSLICKECEIKETEEQLIKAYNTSIGYILKFNKIYEANLNNKYCEDYDGEIEKLNYLELIYLYVILIKNKPNYFGKLGAKKFPLFLHEEFYSENIVLKNLHDKSMVFYMLGSSTMESINYIKFYKGFYKDGISLETQEILSDLEARKIELFNVLLKPKGFNFKEYEEFLLDRIKAYKLNFTALEDLSIFLKNRRKMEVLFLSNVVEYNTEFKLLMDNAIDYKFFKLQESYNLKEIYGYFNTSVNSTLYKLDTLSDRQRKFLKNKIYSNIFKSEKDKKVFEKKLPANFRKSSLLGFIEEHYELDCVWEDVPVNEFIKVFFKRLEYLGKFSAD